jgi:hypothetical protein
MELRFLDAERRQEAARYIAVNRLSPHDSVVLARAIKEHQRRPDTAEGFSDAAGDCLAFKYFRDGREMRSMEEKLRYASTFLCSGGKIGLRTILLHQLTSFEGTSGLSRHWCQQRMSLQAQCNQNKEMVNAVVGGGGIGNFRYHDW